MASEILQQNSNPDTLKDRTNFYAFLQIAKKAHRELDGHEIANARFSKVKTSRHAEDYLNELMPRLKENRHILHEVERGLKLRAEDLLKIGHQRKGNKMNFSQFFQDGNGKYSATRLALVMWSVGVLVAWLYKTFAIASSTLPAVDSSIIAILGLFISGKVVQSFSPNDQAKT